MRLLRWGLVCLCFAVLETQARTLVFSGIAGSENSTISERVLREAYRALDIHIVVELYPGKRALAMSGSGRVDGELFRIGNLSKQYPELIQTPTSINVLEGVYVSLNPDLHISDWSALGPYFIGIQRGIKFVEKALAQYPDFQVLTVNKNEQLMGALVARRIDLGVLARLNALSAMKAYPDNRFYIGKNALVTHPLFHYLHKKHSALVPLLDAVLREMTESGRISEIRQEFIDSF